MVSKKFYKTKTVCDVTFQLPEGIVEQTAEPIKTVTVVGDFNDWQKEATPLKKYRGVWRTKLELDIDQEYQYRFLINGSDYHNDWDADKYVPNNVDGDNSVVVTVREA